MSVIAAIHRAIDVYVECKPPSYIIMHPKLYQQLVHTSPVNQVEQHYNLVHILNFQDLRIIRSLDVKEDEILIG